MGHMDVTIGVCAYNEAQNIERSIRSIYSQRTQDFRIKETIVVSSGSDDGTDEIVGSLQKDFSGIRLIRQEKREGKNSAINAYLDAKDCDIVVMLNADNVLGTESSLQNLLEPFKNEKIGMVGGHPIPTNSKDDKVGFADHVIWSMHHNLAEFYPKIGELVAFRDIGTRLPTDQQSDETILRMHLENAGYSCVYAPGAIVYNRGPETEEDFMKQRTRINIGECYMMKRHGYQDPSWKASCLMRAAFGTIRDLGLHPSKMMYAYRMEMRARAAAKRYVEEGKDDMNIWDPVDSTKDV